MAFTQITVTGTIQNSDGTPANGGIRFTPTWVMRNGTPTTEINARTSVHAQVTAGVLGSVTLAATTDPGTTPTGVTYLVEEFLTGQPRISYFIAVPHDGGAISLDTHPRAGDAPPSAIVFPSPGPPGETGDTGPAGAPGADGADGANGADGLDGVDGRTILSGSGTPAGGIGTDGDFYIDTAADAIYGPKTAGAWGAATSLTGEQGPPGTGSVDTVNGDAGPNIVLDAADVGAATSGRAAALSLILGV